MNSQYPKTVSFSTTIPFDQPLSYMAQHTITGALTFVKSVTGAYPGYGAMVRLVADGSHTPDFSDFASFGAGAWVNTSGTVNQVFFFYDGSQFCYAVSQPGAGGVVTDTTPPTFVSAVANNSGGAGQIIVTASETLYTTSAGSGHGFTSNKTINFVSVSGSTITISLSGTLTAGETITLSYSNSGLWIKDTAGNAAASATISVTNAVGSATTLNAPTGVTLGTATSTTQPLTWTDANSSPNESGYKVYKNTVNTFGTATLVTTTAADATSYTVTGLTASTTYYYWVVAAGNGTTTSDSSPSTVASGSTASASATLENTTWIDWWNFAEPTAILTRTSGSDTFLNKLWDQMNKTGATASAQTDTLVMGVDANQPKLIASGINGLPSIEISPSGPNHIATSSVESKAKPLTIFFVAQPKLIPAAQKNFMQSDSAAQTANIGLDENGKVSVLGGGSTYLKGTTSMVVDGKYVIVVVFDTTTRIYVNGTLEASGNAGTDANAQLYHIGRDDAGCASAWLADIAIYQGDMDSTSRDSITNQLKTKYGIS